MFEEQLRLAHAAGHEHFINVSVECSRQTCDLTAIYDHGTANVKGGAVIVQWSADYEPPLQGIDLGHVMIGRGRIDIEVAALRGIGLGGLLMQPLIRWVKEHPSVPVVPINLSADDARAAESRAIRNRFYEKLGFQFEYRDEGASGESTPMNSHELITPCFGLSRGWKVESISNSGTLFLVRASR